MAFIEVRNLTRRVGDRELLKNISLDVAEGETAVFIGPSGGGKSTLLRCLNGLEEFHEGSVTVAGHTVHATERPADKSRKWRLIRASVGMVFQQFHLFPHMTALRNVMSGPLFARHVAAKEAEARARKELARVGLAEHADKLPAQLSGGQQQRVAIARALAVSPKGVLFDEPTSALDPTSAAGILDLVAELGHEGPTVVLVTHAMEFARKAATTVRVMAAGEVVEEGPPARVFGSPEHAVTRGFLG